MLTADDVHFSYGSHPVLAGVSVSIQPGRILAILGPNGAGKTTLFRLLSGAETPAQGRVTLDGRAIHQMAAKELARRRAVLPQTSQLGFNFTVREVVEMGRLPHAEADVNKDEEAIVDEAMKRADIADFAERHYMSLSGGERQRVQLARALAQAWPEDDDSETRYLLLDEPTNNLDIGHQHACLREAKRLAERGAGVACIVHDFNLALAYADDCVVLHQARVRAAGPTRDALTAPVISDVFEVEATLIEQAGHRLLATTL